MSVLMQRLKTDWERTLFWTMLVFLLGILSFWLFHGNEEGTATGQNRVRTRPSFLGKTPYAFLDAEAAERVPNDAFSFGFKLIQKRPWLGRKKTGTTAKKPRPPRRTRIPIKPKTPTKPAPTPAPTPAKPAAPPPARVLTYRGYLESTTHQMIAFVSVANPATKKTSMVRLSVGRKIDGIEIKEFSGEMLQVIDPKGKPLQIAKGGRKKIVLE